MRAKNYILMVAFFSGMSTMSLEIAASRLLAPYFGTSIFVWTNIIGIVLISLSIGYYYGGRLADEKATKELLSKILFLAGIFFASIIFIAPVIMKLSISAISSESFAIFYASLLGSAVLLVPPTLLLASVVPISLKLYYAEVRAENQTEIGRASGIIFAVSTVGSIIGTFLPALFLIPFLGTKGTIALFSFILVFISLFGLSKKFVFGAFFLFLVFSAFYSGEIKAKDENLVFAGESAHNYIRIGERNGIRYLELNEGYAYHSIYNPNSVFVNGVWDYFAVFPLVRKDAENAAILGLAGGTIAGQYERLFPYIGIDGVEIDGKIIEASEKFMRMRYANLKVHVNDARVFLEQNDTKYDIIIADAYKQPYIPFHMATKEFFDLTRSRLKEGGILAINVAATNENAKIARIIKNTIKSVYKNVYIFHPEGTLNYIIFASDEEIFPSDINMPVDLNLFQREHERLNEIVSEFRNNVREVEFDSSLGIFTDDKAPVELYTELMIFEYIKEGRAGEYAGLFEE